MLSPDHLLIIIPVDRHQSREYDSESKLNEATPVAPNPLLYQARRPKPGGSPGSPPLAPLLARTGTAVWRMELEVREPHIHLQVLPRRVIRNRVQVMEPVPIGGPAERHMTEIRRAQGG